MKTKNVLITGVSSGLGAAMARQLLEAGARVWGCSRREPEALAGTAGMHFFPLDLSDGEGGEAALKAGLADCPDLDAVILNAGMLGKIEPLLDTPVEGLRQVMEVNVWANQWILRTVLRGRKVGQVVAISSGAAVNAYTGWGAYNVSKAALNMFVAIVAGENPGTHFSALAPGLIDTAMQDILTALPEDGRHGPIDRLKAAKASGAMLAPDQAASQILGLLSRLRELESGSFADLRDFS